MAYINKQQMSAILKDAQAQGLDPKAVITSLAKKGNTIEGFNSNDNTSNDNRKTLTNYQANDIINNSPNPANTITHLVNNGYGTTDDNSILGWAKKAVGTIIGNNSITRKLRTGAESLGKSVLGAAAGAAAEIPKVAGNISNVMNPISGQFAKAQGDALGNQIASLAPQGTETAQKIGGGLAQLVALFAIPEEKVSELTGLASKIPEGATALQYLMKGADILGNAAVQATGYEAVDKGQLPTAGEIGTFGVINAATEGLGYIAKNSASTLLNKAEQWYQSALKPSTTLSPEETKQIVKTGLKEGIQLTQAGVDKLKDKIASYEEELGKVITEAGKGGQKIPSHLQPLQELASQYKSANTFARDIEKVLSQGSNYNVAKNLGKEYLPLLNQLTTLAPIMKENAINTKDALIKFYNNTQQTGAMIPTAPLKDFLTEVKQLFGNTVDVAGSDADVKEINTIYENFIKKYGDQIPIEEAQKLKTNTYALIKKKFGSVSSANIETQKQLARGLKEGIVDAAPQAGDINANLKKLYSFEDVLDKAHGRIGNLNVFGIGATLAGSAVGAVTGNPVKAGVASSVMKLLTSPAAKSDYAIIADRIGQLFEKMTPAEKEAFFAEYPMIQKMLSVIGVDIKGHIAN